MPRIFIDEIAHEGDSRQCLVTVRVGDEEPRTYQAALHDDHVCSVDEPLFMRLSDLGVQVFCNCAIYQFELMCLIQAHYAGQELPAFPIELGTTDFGLKRPSKLKILWDRIRRPFALAWLTWTTRHIRREMRQKQP